MFKINYLFVVLVLSLCLALDVKGQEYVADPGFVAGTGVNSTVWDIELQSDGKIIVLGTFSAYNGVPVNGIMRLNSDGSLDNAYQANMGSGFGDLPSKVPVKGFLHTDGSLYVIGSFSSLNGKTVQGLAKIKADGTPDDIFNNNLGTGFTLGGSVTTGTPTVYSVAFQSDGKIVIGGYFGAFNGLSTVKHFLRLNSDGTLDNTFNGNGKFDQQVRDVAITSDGKIIVAGYYGNYQSSPAVAVGKIARLNSDGTLDAAFNAGGTGFNNANFAIALQPDGKIIVAGASVSYNGNAAASDKITRLNSDGTLDASFNTGGTGVNTGTTHPQYIAVQNDGKIVVYGEGITAYNGTAVSPANIIRLNANGTLDNTLNIITDFSNITTVRAFVKDNDGKLLIGGSNNRFVRLVDKSTLPVNLLSFTAKSEKNDIILSWKTASEKDNDIFIVERSTDAVNWLEIGWLKGAGTNNETVNYQLHDHKPLNGLSYYRLIQKDNNGKITVFDPISLNYSLSEGNNIKVYPNPFVNIINIELGFKEGNILITDIQGKTIYQKSFAEEGNIIVNIGNVGSGIYNISVISKNGEIFNRKLIKVN
ncbi:T9SS type A sorting domain-containing protein [Pseudopedobacter beijingensis]|uniref:T9SS type A sorting domain-containing protein n=1 Tax=Pseudopedobacter beijingensis TaxID=1207056 RepID=A0ABW4IDE5_9SPHI